MDVHISLVYFVAPVTLVAHLVLLAAHFVARHVSSLSFVFSSALSLRLVSMVSHIYISNYTNIIIQI